MLKSTHNHESLETLLVSSGDIIIGFQRLHQQ